MLGALRRVISGDDFDQTGGQQQQQQQQQYHDEMNAQAPGSSSGITNTSSGHSPMDTSGGGGAVLVEHDHGDNTEYSDHDAPLDLIAAQPDRNASDTFTTSSSLSDASTHDGICPPPPSSTHHQVDVYMEDVLVEVDSPTPLAGVGSGPDLGVPTHYQQHLQHRHLALGGGSAPTSSTSGGINHHHHSGSPPRTIQRMESLSDGSDSGSARATTTSQNSSRDWGWFEDVHQSGHLTPTGSTKALRSADGGGHGGDGKGRRSTRNKHSMHRMVVGLDPRDETEAVALAVTAPTYVLEETLSSQRLWKESAGRRPPQPFEERAFYEKMWAQNFAKSQVNYQMPVEVLTATTPISLNPFAEGGTMEMSPADAADGGNNFQQYNMNVNAPAETHNMMMMPSSRGAGVSGKSRDGGDGGDEPSRLGGLKETPRPAPPSVLPPMQHQHIVNKTAKTESGENLTVLVRGDNVFGTTVSKSFALSDEKGGPITSVVTVNISIASYRVVESRKRGKYAQFLVIYREGSIRDTIGVWKRYSDFDDLAKKVTQAHEGCASVIANMSPLAITEEHEVEHLPNAITSWRLLKKRQRWYRCLDSGYLSLKVFLLERFLHDILFESSSPKLLREFVGGADDSMSR